MVKDFGDFKNSLPGEIFDYYRTKRIPDLSLEEMAFVHLDSERQRYALADCYISSNLFDLSQTMAAAFNNVRTKQYVPLYACFSMLDQIGTVYKRVGKSNNYNNGIKKALDFYSSFNSAIDLEFLVTVRHGLFHNGSLAYINSSTNTKTFVRMGVATGQLLTPSKKPWDGIYYDDMSDYVTKIDLKEFQALTLEVISTCRQFLVDGQVVVNAQSPKELFFKYLF